MPAKKAPVGRPPSNPPPITIFVSYSHKDAVACQKLRTHLAPLKRDGIEIWWDEEILGGAELDPKIRWALRRSSIFVALVSPEYLASHYCFDIEYQYALGRARRKTMHVVAAIIRPSGWKHTRMARYKALPKDGKATTQWTNRDQAYEDIADGVRRVVQLLKVPPAEKPAVPNKPTKTSARKKKARATLPGKRVAKRPPRAAPAAKVRKTGRGEAGCKKRRARPA